MLATKLCGVAVPRLLLVILFSATFLSNTGCRQEAYRRGAQNPDRKYQDLLPTLEYPPEAKSASLNCTGFTQGCVSWKDQNSFQPQHFSLAYIEFDDAGELWSIGNERSDRATDTRGWPTSQLEEAIKLVTKKKQEAAIHHQELRVLTFVHGWHNNASKKDEEHTQNLHNFKESLEILATRNDCTPLPPSAASTPNASSKPGDSAKICPVVVGIFISWRGRLVYNDFFHLFTYANRRGAANRVGGVSMTEGVMLLALATKGAPAPYDEANRCQQTTKAKPDEVAKPADAGREPEPDEVGKPTDAGAEPEPNPKTMFLVVGHSFGARALLHGVAQPLLALLLEQKAQSESCVDQWNKNPLHAKDPIDRAIIMSPVDLIALLNPADDALATKSMIEALKRSNITDTVLQRPLIVSVKSVSDSDTGWVMDLAQQITGSRPKMHGYDTSDGEAVAKGQVPKRPSACEQGQLALPQKAYYQHSAGTITNMDSHILIQLDPLGHPGTKVDPGECKKLTSLAPGGKIFWGEGKDGPNSPGYCFDLIPAADILAQEWNIGDNQIKGLPDASKFDRCKLDEKKKERFPQQETIWNDTPFYVMQAPKILIPDHDGIFRVGVFNLLLTMIADQPAPMVTVAPSATMPSKQQTPVPPDAPKH